MDALDTADLFNYITAAALSAVCAALCAGRAGKRPGAALFWRLLAGFYVCICMSHVFYLIAWVVVDYPFVFSPGDISWVGALLFLITAALSLMDGWTPEQKLDARAYRLPALIAPAVCAAFNIAFVAIYPDILINYLLYAFPTALLAYLSLWLFLAGQKGGVGRETRFYHLAVLAWVAVQLFYDLFNSLGWDYGYALPALISGWTMTALTVGVYLGARKGEGP